MKRLCILLALCANLAEISAQQLKSENGWVLPPKGALRVLVIFAETDCGSCPQPTTCGTASVSTE